ncbi:DUF3017 domain-containing protein [Goodfellowiella coeruleoviolacea]|uniref:DUF3017 domain-containing protein n=1 Tax=Goodfellowiella coeruleoviolacea TaxID=334858 RepID=A0AAE3GCH0_9PSEU|nr:DUF3017 domain-containing protein [Goodfellowiella coeruleoviolacea]MCP2165722.1 Protein of unknown function (DUF3017) [Goodfellowiella coeruleoviolacea]
MPDQRRGRSAVVLHLPFAVVLVLVAIGIVRLAQYYWREGTVLIGLALLVAAALRALLANEQAGLLAIRSRSVDVLLYSAFGVAVMAVALTITGGPFG